MVAREHERCEACGFDGAQYTDAELLVALRSLGEEWHRLLTRAGDLLRVRPEPATWSAIEYAAHSRDITTLHVFGVEQALARDEPAFPAVDASLVDEAAEGYADSDADEVARSLGTAADDLASVAEEAGTDRWSRGLTVGDVRSDVRRLLEHALHDSLHHVGDVGRALSTMSSSAPDGGSAGASPPA